MKTVVNQNVNYINHTSSSAPGVSPSSSLETSLSTIIRNNTLIIKPNISKQAIINNKNQFIPLDKRNDGINK